MLGVVVMDRTADGAWIRELRASLGLSQVEFAARVGVSNVTVSRWEQGHVQPGPATLRRLRQLTPRAVPTDGAGVAAPPVGNLPHFTTTLFGRERELATIAHHAGQSSVVTIVGPAGCGKTRLAVEVGRRLGGRFSDGVWFIDLAAVTSPDGVPAAAARALNIHGVRQTPLLERISAAIADREMLIVVDNCEHVVAAATDLIALLARAVGVRVIATSRAVVGLPNERIVALGSLPLDDAIDLFRDRAREHGSSFANVDGDGDDAIANICRRLDGLPLGIELAAARSRILSVSQIARRLDDRFALLAASKADDRHASLRAAVDWSHGLLSDLDQIVFRRLGIFAGSFDVDAAEAVCADSSFLRPGLLNAIDELVRQSLVVVLPDHHRRGVTRYRLLETIRDYARARLEDAGEFRATLDRQATHLLSIARTIRSGVNGPRHQDAISAFNQDADNLIAAIDLAARHRLGARATELCATLWPVWNVLGLFAEGARHLDRAVPPNGPVDAILAEALTGAAMLHVRLGKLETATAHAERAHACWHEIGDAAGAARALDLHGLIAQRSGLLDEACARHEEALRIWQSIGNRGGAARSLNHLGQLANVRGDRQTAELHYTEAWSLSRGVDDLDLEATLLVDLGELSGRTGRYRQSVGFLERAFAANERLGNPDRAAAIIANLAEVRVQTGDVKRAVIEATDGVARYRQLGNRAHLADALYILGIAHIADDDVRKGLATLREALAMYADFGNDIYVAETIQAIAEATIRLGAAPAAARWLGGATAIQQRARVEPYAHFDYDGARAAIEAALGAETMAAEMAGGAAMSVTQLVLDVLHHADPIADATIAIVRRASTTDRLTDRQRQVLRLVVAGLSNRDVAATLGISERTVERHLSAIYTVLNVDRRAGAVAYAVAHGLASSTTT